MIFLFTNEGLVFLYISMKPVLNVLILRPILLALDAMLFRAFWIADWE